MIFRSSVILIVLAMLSSLSGLAQITYGRITYERKTNLYKKYKNDSNIKEWLREEDKNKIDVFELFFNDTASIFKIQESDLVERMSWSTSKNVVYQNYKTKVRYTEKKIWGESFVVTDSVRKFQWKITDSKRNICGYQCRKAIWQANDSTRIYAWFCLEINNSIGPESILGLPGAILGLATEDGGVIYFAKSVEVIKPNINTFNLRKVKKTYKAAELKEQLEKEYGKEKWGKAMIYNNFAIW